MTSKWSFLAWGIDIIGKISPKSSEGHKFILFTINYFTKWVEGTSYVRLTAAMVVKFIRSHIICRYGVPHELIYDKGVHFRDEMDSLLQRYGIQHHISSPYRPQTNRVVEAVNKNVKRILRKMVATTRRSVREASLCIMGLPHFFPYFYKSYSIFIGVWDGGYVAVELEMGSLRVTMEQQIWETEWAQAQFDKLSVLDKRRLRAANTYKRIRGG